LGVSCWVVSPEDLLISKLIWIQDIVSEQQKEDIVQLLQGSEIDRPYVVNWIRKLRLTTYGISI
jgi:hypothetical protein